MKDENIKLNIQEELERAKEALKSADIFLKMILLKMLCQGFIISHYIILKLYF